MDKAESLFKNWFQPRLERYLSKTPPILSDQQKNQLKRWAEVLAETDESLRTRSRQRQSVRRRARNFARNVLFISAELFDLCSLSFAISALPSITDGSFYEDLQNWWTAHLPKASRTENSKQSGQGVPSSIEANKDSPTISAPLSESGDFMFRLETEIPQKINPCDAPQDGFTDAMSIEQIQNPATLSSLARGNDFSRPRSDGSHAPTTEFDVRHISSKRPRMDFHNLSEYFSPPEKKQYLSFNFTRRHMIDKLSEPLKTGIQNSRQWKDEQEIGGLSVTNCLSLYLPEKVNMDSFLVVRMGYLDGFQVSHLLGIGDPENQEIIT